VITVQNVSEDIGEPTVAALGRTISPVTVATDLASMRLSEWRRAYANQWDDEVDGGGWSVIPATCGSDGSRED
jgi:hypothetical protein